MKGLILAGGLGTRLRPLTHTGAKQLIPIANKPVLVYCIEDLKQAGITDIGIIVGYTKERMESITNALGDGSRWGARITYIEQDAPRGIAHAVYCAKEFIGNESFVVYLGDNMLKEGIGPFVEKFKTSKADAAILLTRVQDPSKYGVASLDKNGRVIDVEEKPKKPESDLVVIGIYIFTPCIFKVIEALNPSGRGEYEITHAIRSLIKSKQYKVVSDLVTGWWDDTGTAEAILHVNHMVLAELKTEICGEIEEGANLIGNVKLGVGSVIKSGSVIRGPVVIGENCTIGPTYLGPYTSIGNNSIIVGGEIESSIIMENALIKLEANKRIVDSLIGKYTNIASSRNTLPGGYKFLIGENSNIQI